jgi:hypothetical protein
MRIKKRSDKGCPSRYIPCVKVANEGRPLVRSGKARAPAFAGVDAAMPFHGDILLRLTGIKPGGAIAQGVSEEENRALAELLAEGLDEQAAAAGVGPAAIVDEKERLAADA